MLEADGTQNLLVRPQVTIDSDQDIVMDSTRARGYDVTVPNQQATPLVAIADVAMNFANGNGIDVSLFGDSFASIYSAHLGPANVPGLLAQTIGFFAKRDSTGGFEGSPFYYQLDYHQLGNAFTGFTKHVRNQDLATIVADYRVAAVAGRGERANFGVVSDAFGSWGIGLGFALPARRTEYLAGTVSWQSAFGEFVPEPSGSLVQVSGFMTDTKRYVPGDRYVEHWNGAVFAPSMANPDPEFPFAGRFADDIFVFAPLFGDAAGRLGSAAIDSARTALYREGRLVGEVNQPFGDFIVPREPTRYRLEVREDHVDALRLSTTTEMVWTFTSAGTGTDAVAALPLTAFGFAPALDERNAARAGSAAVIPITVTQQPNSGAGHLTSLTVDVSYDDGATWRHAKVVRVLGHWLLILQHPKKSGFVSLRAQAADSAGNTVRETILRAYQLR